MDIYQIKSYSFELPNELIAQSPASPRDSSRLMIVDRKTGNITEIAFRDLKDMLTSNDQLIFNNTKVIPARLFGRKLTGAKIEVFLSKNKSGNLWETLVRPAKKIFPGDRIIFNETFYGEVCEKYENGLVAIEFFGKDEFRVELEKAGQIPLPHYIKRGGSNFDKDLKDYQTIYAKNEGAVAAPTAGLHFTDIMFNEFNRKKVELIELTLHVGLGTFKPVTAEDIREHQMHYEEIEVSEGAASSLNNANANGLQIAVGTTSCRALESMAEMNKVRSGRMSSNLFIYPGYKFKFVKNLLTNFHLPCSSLLLLVYAFGGVDLIKEAYHKAIKEKFRFYSYGDSMLIL